jgi:hypothetical protein
MSVLLAFWKIAGGVNVIFACAGDWGWYSDEPKCH